MLAAAASIGAGAGASIVANAHCKSGACTSATAWANSPATPRANASAAGPSAAGAANGDSAAPGACCKIPEDPNAAIVFAAGPLSRSGRDVAEHFGQHRALVSTAGPSANATETGRSGRIPGRRAFPAHSAHYEDQKIYTRIRTRTSHLVPAVKRM
ncbi:g3709 [Coccomyxa elongata]